MSTNNLGLTLEQSVKYQGRFGQWAWIFHRISGLGVLLFLIAACYLAALVARQYESSFRLKVEATGS